MKNNDIQPGDAEKLRKQSEKKVREETLFDLSSLSKEEMRQTLQDLRADQMELRVHQIELEMQNEELRRVHELLEIARSRYFDLYDLAPVGYCTISEKGLISEANITAASLLEVARGALVKKPFTRFILKEHQDIYYLQRKQLLDTGVSQACELQMVKNNGTSFWAHLDTTLVQDDDGCNEFRVVISDITGSKRMEASLQKAFDDIKTLRGIIPICSHCKKIRDDQGCWNQVEVYVRDHTEAEFSHGICPECMKELYPDNNMDEDAHAPENDDHIK